MNKYKKQDLQKVIMHLVTVVGDKSKMLIFKTSLNCCLIFNVMASFLNLCPVNSLNGVYGS